MGQSSRLFQKSFEKKRDTKSGQAASKIKKWKFEDEMSFLLPYMQERDTCTNLTGVSDDDDEDEQNTEKINDNNDDRKDDRNDSRSENEDIDNNDDVDKNESNAENEKTKNQSKINRNIITKMGRNEASKPRAQLETASAVVMKYLLEKKTADAPIKPPTKQPSAIESFFSSIATTVEKCTHYQNIAKSKIFAIVTDLEMQQIMHGQQFLLPNLPAQRPCSAPMTRIPLQSHQLHPTGQYNVNPSPISSLSSPFSPSVSTITTPSASPSPTATPNPPPFHYGLPEANQMGHEEVNYNEYMQT